MALSKDIIAEIKERVDIVHEIGQTVQLRHSGADWVGLCPFHGEKTPSFRVSSSRRMYHCFGCGVGGSVIDYVMASENLSFAEAATALAERHGIALPEKAGYTPKDRGQEVLEKAQAYYHQQLLREPQGEAARMYLRERGFDTPTWEAFHMGFALDGWQGFTDHARGLGFSQEDLLASGLVRVGSSGRPYDMLRKRVVFPILGEQARPIAFGGRVIDAQDNPKYLNTPETRFYHKSRVLFGLAQGKKRFREAKRAVLVEGYLDVIRLHEAGFAEACATCGTSLTEEHLKLLERFVDKAVLVFDGDDAGIKAALRTAPLFLNRGLEARVVLLPGGADPDDFVSAHGPDAFEENLGRAVPILEFLIFQLLARNGNTLSGKEKTLTELVPLLNAVGKASVRDVTVRYLSDLIGVRVESILSLLTPGGRTTSSGYARQGYSRPETSGGTFGASGRASVASGHASGASGHAQNESAENLPDAAASLGLAYREGRHQRRFMRLLLLERHLITLARDMMDPKHLQVEPMRRLFEKMLRLTDEEVRQVTPEELMDLWPEQAPTIRELLVEETYHQRAVMDTEQELRYEMVRIKEEMKVDLMRKLKALTAQVQETQPSGELTEAEITAVRNLREAVRELNGQRALFRKTHKPKPELSLRDRQVPAP